MAITTALLSKLLDVPVSEEVAFTGEISLKGNILRIGGLKEKLIAAYNAGIKKVYIPATNESELANIPLPILEKIEIKLVSNYETIYNDIFASKNSENNIA